MKEAGKVNKEQFMQGMEGVSFPNMIDGWEDNADLRIVSDDASYAFWSADTVDAGGGAGLSREGEAGDESGMASLSRREESVGAEAAECLE